MALLNFEEAIADAGQFSKRHLILGNGFSIACRADIFHYASLFAQADFSKRPELAKAFALLKTQDFEVILKALEISEKLLSLYGLSGSSAEKQMAQDVAALKEILVHTIASNHPHVPGQIADQQFLACRKFLAHFLTAGGQVFTLNYDLLLYWALMHDDAPPGAEIHLETNDGFGNDEDDPDADYVVWRGEVGAHEACVHFLHGALHLFDTGTELKKYTWVRKGEPLIEQVRAALQAGAFPLFVAEGTTAQKKDKIRHNAYLYQGLKQLTSNAMQGRHCFFIFGHSLATNDDHILNRLGRGRFSKLYVGLHGDDTSGPNQAIKARAQGLTLLRRARSPLQVEFFDAATARVWG